MNEKKARYQEGVPDINVDEFRKVVVSRRAADSVYHPRIRFNRERFIYDV